MHAQGFLDQPLFSIWLASDETKDFTGELNFGGIQSRYFSGPLNQIPVNSRVSHLLLPEIDHTSLHLLVFVCSHNPLPLKITCCKERPSLLL